MSDVQDLIGLLGHDRIKVRVSLKKEGERPTCPHCHIMVVDARGGV